LRDRKGCLNIGRIQEYLEVGIPGYGVSGLFSDPNDNRAHGRDERVLIKSYYDSQEFLYRLVKELSSGTVVP
jgi:acetylornithine deacetylase/succinyl-diaminopimelate desuccinylase-like protein